MKKNFLLIGCVLILTNSCKKDSTDETIGNYIGTWEMQVDNDQRLEWTLELNSFERKTYILDNKNIEQIAYYGNGDLTVSSSTMTFNITKSQLDLVFFQSDFTEIGGLIDYSEAGMETTGLGSYDVSYKISGDILTYFGYTHESDLVFHRKK
jgi:hypothetical protein